MTPVSWLPTASSSMMGLLSKIGISNVVQSYMAGSIGCSKLAVLEIIPCPHEDFFEMPVFAVSIDSNFRMFSAICSIACTCFMMFQLNFYASTCIYYLVCSKPKNSSRVTSDRQKKFFFGILIQISIPYLFITPAFIFGFYSIFNNFYSQNLNNLVMIFLNFYGTVATFALLFSHTPYRDFMRKCICMKKQKKKTMHGKISVSGNRASVFG
ncbi:CBN-SRH-76 protein [Caenorhabditis brenneri]|uniref:CBN-SRH-76 protein n=1 Tax=Caenorhabditis brenneri TaxID=135651 RepID=G0MXJ9_CAEBE|nr:CBN-SRH-76 protein [Caenorhabditis brenneri]